MKTGWMKKAFYLGVECGTNIHLIAVRIKLGVTPQMAADDEACEKLVLYGVDGVLDDTENVET